MPRKRRPVWNDDSTITLVAYLDHYVKKRSEGGVWSTDVILSQLSKHLRGYNLRQIKEKLFMLSRCSNAASRERCFDGVFKYGSRCLPGLPPSLIAPIQHELTLIDIEEQDKVLSTPPTLRNGKTRAVSTEPLQPISRLFVRRKSFAKSFAKSSPNRHPQETECHSSAPLHTGQIITVMRGQSISPHGTPSNAQRLTDTTQFSGAVKKESRSSSDHTGPNLRDSSRTESTVESARTCAEIPDSDGDSLIADNLDIVRTDSGHTGSVFQPTIPFVSIDEMCSSTLKDKRVERVTSAVDEANASEFNKRLLGLLDDNARLRQELASHKSDEAECVNLERHEASLKRRSIEDPNWSKFREIHRVEASLKDYRRRLQILEDQQKISEPSHINKAFGRIQTKLNETAHHICELVTNQGFKVDTLRIDEPVLKALQSSRMPSLTHIFDLCSRQAQALCTLDSSLSLMALLSIAGIAIYEWVFLRDNPCALLLSTPMLDQYRIRLKCIYTEEALHNIDLAAQESIIHDEHFSSTYLKPMASELAAKLITCFVDIGVKFGRSERTLVVKERLENVFYETLIIKHDLVISKDKFGLVWVGSDSIWDEHCMQSFPPDYARFSERHAKSAVPKVRFTVVPGIRRYPKLRKLADHSVFLPVDHASTEASELLTLPTVSIK